MRTLLIGLSFGLIAFVVFFFARQQVGRWLVNFESAGTLSHAAEDYRALEAIRSGNTNEALNELESRLDMEIISLHALIPEQTNAKKRAAYVRILNKIRLYRLAHPWKSGQAEVDQSVREALSSVTNTP